MMTQFIPQHIALYFGEDALKQIHARREDAEFAPAWAQLQADAPPNPDGMSALIWQATRYRLQDDQQAGTQAITTLKSITLPASAEVSALTQLLALMHAFEMLRDHDAWEHQQDTWLTRLHNTLEAIFSIEEARPVEWFWRIPIRLAGAVLLEDEGAFNAGIADYEHAIDEHMHAEGYLKNIVILKDGKSFENQQASIKALVLAAEIAHSAGYDLWQYEKRGVSLATGVAYQIYYYYFPDKWRWETETTAYDEAYMQQAFTQEGAYVEIANLRVKPRNMSFLLEDHRPFFDALGGGFTTLTHGIINKQEKSKRRGWFG